VPASPRYPASLRSRRSSQRQQQVRGLDVFGLLPSRINLD
jgi:hypothetical protein